MDIQSSDTQVDPSLLSLNVEPIDTDAEFLAEEPMSKRSLNAAIRRYKKEWNLEYNSEVAVPSTSAQELEEGEIDDETTGLQPSGEVRAMSEGEIEEVSTIGLKRSREVRFTSDEPPEKISKIC